MKKLIDLETETIKPLTSMALDNDMKLKNFIESQLIKMGEIGIPYLDLYNQHELVLLKLKQLQK